MNKQEFLNQLRAALAPLPAVEREDILADYEEHFRIAGETGHSEETVAAALGDPRELARIYIEGMDPPPFDPTDPTLGGKAAYPYAKGSRASNGHPWIVTGVVLFNVFIGAWMLLGLIGAWIGLWMVPIAIALAGIASIVAGIFIPMAMSKWTFILAGIALIALGILAVIGMVYVTKYFFKGIRLYFSACGKLCKEGKL
nr:DUF1700 domain-containing protein [uncultured Solibaculum sp.]